MMKWMKKAGCMALALSVVFSLAEPVQVQAKSKKVKTTNVTLIKGENQCFTFRKLKIKKIKVKYSKKGVVKVKLGKDPKVGRFIQIASKKKGTTLVTVKAYTTKKKYKTLKYKVKVTTYLEIANSKAAKQKAKKAFALQNKYRKEAGVSALEWSDEMYDLAKIRAREIKKNFSHFGSTAKVDLFGTTFIMGENIAAGYSLPNKVVNAWKQSSGHYKNMISDEYKCCAIACYDDYWVTVFSYQTSSELINLNKLYGKIKLSSVSDVEWLPYEKKYAQITVRRFNETANTYITGTEFSIYNKENKYDTIRSWEFNGSMKKTVTMPIIQGQTYVIYERYAPNGIEKAKRMEFIPKPLSEGTNEIVLK